MEVECENNRGSGSLAGETEERKVKETRKLVGMADATQIEVVETRTDKNQDTTSESTTSGSKEKSFSQKLMFWKSDSNSRRPPDNKWLQQQIPACRPVFTAVSAFFGFMIIGLAFLVIGAIFTAYSATLREFSRSYENCPPIDTDEEPVRLFRTCEDYLTNISTMDNFQRRSQPDCHCNVNFTLPQDIRSRWFFYYGLDNFYQNHRRYLNSWDVEQLRGNNFRSPSSDCRPIIRLDNVSSTQAFPVVPCGLIGNSFFNDSFDNFTSRDGATTVTLDRTDIAWNTDRTIRFRNPGGTNDISESELDGTIMPPNWPQDLSEIGRGLQNESLMVWYRVAAFPWFKKLYGRPSVNGDSSGTLPAGEYNIVLTYNFPVGNFNGKKLIVLTEVNWLGGRNLFLGVVYLVMGAILIITAVALLLMHYMCSKWKLTHGELDM